MTTALGVDGKSPRLCILRTATEQKDEEEGGEVVNTEVEEGQRGRRGERG